MRLYYFYIVFFLNFGILNCSQIISEYENKKTLAISSLATKNVLLGHINYAKDSRFVRIASPYTIKKNIYLERRTYLAFMKMHTAAKKEGVTLIILSAARNFAYQKAIWERKWKRTMHYKSKGLFDNKKRNQKRFLRAKDILTYSSMPTSSRHHWGTEIDFNSLNNNYFKRGKGKNIYQWLKKNASNFGFCQTYTPKSKKRAKGYNEESWHWSYIPVSIPLTKFYLKTITYNDIKNFSGADLAPKLKIIEDYVAGIAPECFTENKK